MEIGTAMKKHRIIEENKHRKWQTTEPSQNISMDVRAGCESMQETGGSKEKQHNDQNLQMKTYKI